MKAWELSHNERMRILDAIREQIGSWKFDELVGELGVEGVLDAFLEAHREEFEEKKAHERAETAMGCFVAFLFFALLAFGAYFRHSGKPMMEGEAGDAFWTLVVAFLCGGAWMIFPRWRNNFTLWWVFLFSGGAVVWMVAVFTAGGIKGWWQWLLGHFR